MPNHEATAIKDCLRKGSKLSKQPLLSCYSLNNHGNPVARESRRSTPSQCSMVLRSCLRPAGEILLLHVQSVQLRSMNVLLGVLRVLKDLDAAHVSLVFVRQDAYLYSVPNTQPPAQPPP